VTVQRLNQPPSVCQLPHPFLLNYLYFHQHRRIEGITCLFFNNIVGLASCSFFSPCVFMNIVGYTEVFDKCHRGPRHTRLKCAVEFATAVTGSSGKCMVVICALMAVVLLPAFHLLPAAYCRILLTARCLPPIVCCWPPGGYFAFAHTSQLHS